MEELVVEWTLVRRIEFVQGLFKNILNSINATSMKLIREQFSDDNGRVDLIYETNNGHVFLVELETSLKGKYTFCLEQTKRYKLMASHFPSKTVHTVILYAKDVTPESLRQKLEVDCKKEKIIIVEYSMQDAQKVYDEIISILSRNIGFEMVDLRSDMPYTISAVNRYMLAFVRAKKSSMTNKEIGRALPTSKGRRKGKPWSQTSVVQNGYLAEGLGFVNQLKLTHSRVKIELTPVGQEFIEQMDLSSIDINNLQSVQSAINLTLEQKRIILTQLLKDNFGIIPRYKAMILLFLRFLNITRGEWVPRQRNFRFGEGDMKMLNHILGTNWQTTTNMGNVLTWSRNYCRELGLIEIMKGSEGESERAVMTTLGSRIYGLMELTQSLKREIIHIPQQIS